MVQNKGARQQFILARSRDATGSDLDCVAVIRGSDALLQAKIIGEVTRISGKMPTVLELGSLDALLSVVEGGACCAVMPELFFSDNFSEKLIVEALPTNKLELKICAVRRKENTMDELWTKITNFCIEFGKSTG